ncbi:hypothetical protein SPHINGO391_10012 [Sphingomonas aurantiaca]|uniref:Uncharacterized protein n=1 Tax=Sphingomonas aurantiaca TaxID=185949 RepID=A0A5E7XRR4_9SPHN|nr:hypothetical protein SPHINGO391_10012 [Sphingomonas aurantiaca]
MHDLQLGTQPWVSGLDLTSYLIGSLLIETDDVQSDVFIMIAILVRKKRHSECAPYKSKALVAPSISCSWGKPPAGSQRGRSTPNSRPTP